jgi:hypothetical protein
MTLESETRRFGNPDSDKKHHALATTERTSLEVRFVPTAEVRSYSITLSARMSSAGGTVRPSAAAVFKLMASSMAVGCSTGMSAGAVPFKGIY